MDLNAEMTEKEIEFIKKLIVEHNPRKIVEIGVAAGGSSVAILKELEKLDNNIIMYSIDLSETHYRDRSQKTGYLIEKYKKEKLQIKTKHELIVGDYAPTALERIGGDIDFLILDTVHSLPGEILDFLAFLPYLKIGAVVVLHDIILNHLSSNSSGYATQVLLDCVVADKLTPIDINDTFPGIGAFRVNNETRKYIDDLFCALMMTWEYMPNDGEIHIYREKYKKEYTPKQIYIFDKAVELNLKTIEFVKARKRRCLSEYGRVVGLLHGKKVYIYGHGFYGNKIADILGKSGVKIEGFVVTQKTKDDQIDIIGLNEFKTLLDREPAVVVGVGRDLQNEIVRNIESIGYKDYILLSDELLSII